MMSDLNQLESDFQRLLQSAPFDDTPAPEHAQDLRRRVLEQFDPGWTSELRLPAWRVAVLKGVQIMQRPAFRLLVTSVCLAIGAFWLFVPGGQTSAQAFNRFATALVASKSARFQMEVKVTGQASQSFKAWYLAPHKFRQELGNLVNISDFAAGKIVSIIPAEKKVVVMTIQGAPPGKPSQNYFERLRELLANQKADDAAHYELLGEKEIAGTRAVGFRFESPAATVTLWGNPVTGEPVRIENVWSGLPRTETVMTDFELNVDVPESLFDMSMPAGYKVQSFEVDASEAREADLIRALEACAELSGGHFPDSLDSSGVMQFLIKAVVAQAKDQKEFSDDQFQGLMKQSLAIGRGFQFALLLPESADAHYAGKGARRGSSERPLVWYRPADGKSYRVIYADFSVKELATAPQVEGASLIIKPREAPKKSQ